MGYTYSCGEGVVENPVEAARWMHLAANKGVANAQHYLAIVYGIGFGVALDKLEAIKWAKLAAAQGVEEAKKLLGDLLLKLDAAQIARLELADQLFWKRGRLTPKQFPDFIGQKRLKARLELAAAAAKGRGESIGHVLLIGRPGSGKTTLANILASTIGLRIRHANSLEIDNSANFTGLLTNLEINEVLFIDEIQRLQKSVVTLLCSAANDFKIDVALDRGEKARSVRVNLPRFSIIGAAPQKERVAPALLSCFSIIEELEDYTVEQLAEMARCFALALAIELDIDGAIQIARSADGTPFDVLNRMHHVRDFAHVNGDGTITHDVAVKALSMLDSNKQMPESAGVRDAIPSEVRREVWRRDQGQCVKCGSRINLEYDHIIPVSKGGSNTARNIELLCEICNRTKSDLIQ